MSDQSRAAMPEPDLTGVVLADRYRVVSKLGAGGMGTVYLAEHTAIGKKFALKVLATKLMERPDLVERFMREARATSMISQRNVVEISDFGQTPHGSVFFAMEYLEGEDLRMLLKRSGRVSWARVRHFAVQICRALEAAHAAGIIHRDMKPDNCFRMTRDGDQDFIKVLDFGIAKMLDDGGKGLTKTGMIFGTAQYMSPEQARALPVDPRVDIYAVGIILYELLCGRVPFKGKNFAEVLAQHMYDTPPPPSQWAPDAGIPMEAEALVMKALLKDPNLRFQSMGEMIAALEAVGTGAGAVAVATEQIMRPDMSAAMSFRGSSASMTVPQTSSPGLSMSGTQPGPGQSGTQPGHSGSMTGQQPDKRILIFGLAGLGLAVFLGLLAVLSSVIGGDEEQPDEAASAAAPAAPAAAPEAAAAPTPAEPTPTATISTVSIKSNVDAAILDTADRGRYGFTNQDKGIGFPLRDAPLTLILQAEGYVELEIEIIPNREHKEFEFELQPEAAAVSNGPKRKPKGKKTKQADDDMPKSSDIKNPFD